MPEVDEVLLQTYARATWALTHEDLDAAAQAVARLEALDGGDPWTALARARLHAALGDAARAGVAWCGAAGRGASPEALEDAASALIERGVDAAPCEAWRGSDEAVRSPTGPRPTSSSPPEPRRR